MMPTYSIPFISIPATTKRGCSLSSGNRHYEDVARLGASWWYNWDDKPGTDTPPPGFVPMSWAGQMINAGDAPIILWCNEPENTGQANLTPYQAATRYAKMWSVYGDRLWPAGCVNPVGDWTGAFVAELHKLGLPTPGHWHIHGYVEQIFNTTVESTIRWWTQMHDRFPGDYIVSEFGTTDGDPGKMRALVDFMDATPWISKYAAFSNRFAVGADFLPAHWPNPAGMRLVDDQGNLTATGIEYCKPRQRLL